MIPPGSRLGPYEIVAPIGAGGMGEVYKARDTRLERTVAVKVLPQHLSSSAEVRQRFEREAKTISQLSHPHICALYDVGREGETEYLVMELLEGETLSDRLAKGPLPLEQTLRYGVEIADALDKAHRQGIVHRDLKPGNVMITRSGVKLLDFGLAKAFQRPLDAAGRGQAAAADDPLARNSLTALPTMAGNQNLTQEGTILGTFQYMAPEQLEGKDADARTDIFAFGCVLFEMATGKKAFSGSSQASLISAIMKEEPAPISSVAPMSPPALDRVVKTCLAKDPEERWQSAGDVGKELKWVAEGSVAGVAAPAPVSARRRNRERLVWVVAALLALTVAGLALRLSTRRAAAPEVMNLSVLPPDGMGFVSTGIFAGPVEVSPDGSRVAYVACKGDSPAVLCVRELRDPAPRVLPGTEGAERPFWSADGRSIGFFADRKLKKIDAAGGPVFTLADAAESRGGTWNRDGVIVYSPDALGGLMRVPAAGGQPAVLTRLGPADSTHRYPFFLPDGRHFLYFIRRQGAGAGRESTIAVGSLDTKETKPVVSASSNAIFAGGYLLYVREGTLVAQAFDPEGLRTRGDPISIVPGLRMDERFSRGVFSASGEGLLAYQLGQGQTLSILRWVDRSGKVLGDVGEPGQYFNGGSPTISPDGDTAAVSIVDSRTGMSDIWLVDLARGARRRFTTGTGDKFGAVWTSDGTRVVFQTGTTTGSLYGVLERRVDGAGGDKTLMRERSGFAVPGGLSPDGRYLLYAANEAGLRGVWAMPLPQTGKPLPIAVSGGRSQSAQLSADGRYVAYCANDSGRDEVYITAFPEPGARWQVSQNGGMEPRWRADGKELYFFGPDNRLMAAQIRDLGSSIAVDEIRPLFQARMMGLQWRYDVSRDGQRFLIDAPLPNDPAPISVVTHWTAALGGK